MTWGDIGGGGGSWGSGGGGGGTWGDIGGGGGSWDGTVVTVGSGIWGLVYPDPLEHPPCEAVLVCIPAELVAIIGGHLGVLELPGMWASQADWEQGYQTVAELQEQLMTGCAKTITELLQDLNVMFAHATGLADGANLTQIETMLPATGARLRAIQDEALDTTGLLNTEIARWPAAGEIPDGWLGLFPRKVTLADILQALRVGSQGEQQNIIDTIAAILDSIDDAAGIGNTLLNLYKALEDSATDSALLGVMMASVIASAAAQNQHFAQLQRIIADLDGGAVDRPGDNILQALRGDVEASAERNAVDKLEAIRQRLVEADPNDDSLLEELRKLLV
jgi:hypothetical protein